MSRHLPCALLIVAWCLGGCGRSQTPSSPAAPAVAVDGLTAVHQLTPSVYTGAEPADNAAFAALQRLGVRTVISVDGAVPDAVSARRHGLRYIHLPIGYDGVPDEVALALAKGLRELPGPIYVHCHHGLHRGPAAAVTACVVAGLFDHAQAEAALHAAGTGAAYVGLWQSVRTARPAEPAALRALAVEWREARPGSALVVGMVAAGEAFAHLGHARAAGWKTPPQRVDLSPAHAALLLREAFDELVRGDAAAGKSAQFREWLLRAQVESRALESALGAWAGAGATAPPPAAIEQRFAALKAGCGQCHRAHRDQPAPLPQVLPTPQRGP